MEKRLHLGRPISEDKRDAMFQHAQVYGASIKILQELPANGLGRVHRFQKDQKYTSFCTAYSTAVANSYMHGKEMSAEYQAALIGFLEGAPILNGADPRDALNALTKLGSLPQESAPFTLDKDGAPKVATLGNWPSALRNVAAQFRDKSYLQINTGPFDAFDNIRVALYQSRLEEAPGVAFTQWFEEWDNPIGGVTPLGRTFLGYHAYIFLDWILKNGETYLVVQNSYGAEFADQGLQYFSRAEINGLFSQKQNTAFIFRKISADFIKQAYSNTQFTSLWDIVKALFRKAFHVEPQIVPPSPFPTPEPQPEPVSSVSPADMVYASAKNYLGHAISPQDPELGCAEAVCNVLHAVFSDFPGENVAGPILSTAVLYQTLRTSPKFKQVLDFEPGDIIISPTGKGTNPAMPHGHTGIVLKYGIASNDSATGIFRENYTIQSWVERFRKQGGYPIYSFRRIAV